MASKASKSPARPAVSSASVRRLVGDALGDKRKLLKALVAGEVIAERPGRGR